MSTSTLSLQHVLAATDLGEVSRDALGYARLLALPFGAKLTVLHCAPDALLPEQERRLERAIQAEVTPLLAGYPRDIVIRHGMPALTILRVAEELGVDLIVMGTHAWHGWQRAFVGSVAESVLYANSCPVLTVCKSERPVAITQIVCPTNFTEVARDALEVARGVAAALHAELTVLTVVDDLIEAPKEADGAERHLLARGRPPERILDCVDELKGDLLVIGAQHRFFRDTTVVGTTTDRIVRYATCPVLVVPRAAAVVARHHEEMVRTRTPSRT